jgi:hypothetical protein
MLAQALRLSSKKKRKMKKWLKLLRSGCENASWQLLFAHFGSGCAAPSNAHMLSHVCIFCLVRLLRLLRLLRLVHVEMRNTSKAATHSHPLW